MGAEKKGGCQKERKNRCPPQKCLQREWLPPSTVASTFPASGMGPIPACLSQILPMFLLLSVGNDCLLQRIVGLILYNSPYVLQSLSQYRYLPWLNIHGNLGVWKCIPMKTLFFIINSRPLILLLWVHYSSAAETKLSLSSFLWYFSKGTTQESCVISPFGAQDGIPPTELCLILQSSLQSKVHMTLVFNLFPKDFVFLACSVQKPTGNFFGDKNYLLHSQP